MRSHLWTTQRSRPNSWCLPDCIHAESSPQNWATLLAVHRQPAKLERERDLKTLVVHKPCSYKTSFLLIKSANEFNYVPRTPLSLLWLILLLEMFGVEVGLFKKVWNGSFSQSKSMDTACLLKYFFKWGTVTVNSPSESLQHNGLHWSRSAESEWEKEKVSAHKQQNNWSISRAGINTASLS